MRRAAIILPLLAAALLLFLWWPGARGRITHDRPRADPVSTGAASAEEAPNAGDARATATRAEGTVAAEGTTCVITLRDADGPVSGVTVELAGAGVPLRAATGPDGVVRFPGRTEERLRATADLGGDPPRSVWTEDAVRWDAVLRLGVLRPAAGETSLDAFLEGVDFRARVRVDAKPGLPEGVRVAQPFARELHRVEHDGILHVRLYGKATGQPAVIVAAPGMIPACANVDLGAGQRAAEFDLRTAVDVSFLFCGDLEGLLGDRLLWRRPPALILRSGTLRLESRPHRLEEEGAWGWDHVLPPGDYILETEVTRVPLHTFRVPARKDPLSVRVDLGTVVHLTLRVVVPAGHDPRDARIRAELAGGLREWMDGAELTLPATLPVRFRGWHPLLVPDPRRGVAESPGMDGVVELTLVPAPLLRFTVAGHRSNYLAVRFYRPGAWTDPAVEEEAMRVGGDTFGLAHAPRGTWDLFLDCRELAPVLLRDVQVGPDGADLGHVPTTRGGAIEIRLEGLPDGALGFLEAVRLDAPTYRRITLSPPAPLALYGLGPGRFRVVYGAREGPRSDVMLSRVEEEVDLDGATTLVRVVDLR